MANVRIESLLSARSLQEPQVVGSRIYFISNLSGHPSPYALDLGGGVVQGKNDPRVVERESRDPVEALRAKGKDVEYLMFEDEGHDVLKVPNRVRCYNAIADFFARHLEA